MKRDHRSSAKNIQALTPKEHKQLIADIKSKGLIQSLHDEAAPLEDSIVCTSGSLYEFFHSNGYQLLRDEVTGKLVDRALCIQKGWVYAFYDDLENPLYVGETGREFMKRFREHSKNRDWWKHWTRVKVLPCPDKAIRKLFESLLGLAGGYLENKNQPPGGDNLLDDVLISLVALGNNNGRPPSFPNRMICNQVDMVRKSLKAIGIN